MGAIDFISKPFSFEELGQKIETVLDNIVKQQRAILTSTISNLRTMDSSDSESLATNSGTFEQNCKMLNLTNREIEIVKLILKGITYKVIAKNLFISEKTVNKHIQNIFEKAGVSNKVELISKLSK